MDSNIGKKLDGRYEITELIGVGGMADVYKAVDVMENRTVAVKILKPEFSQNEEFLRRFRNESKAIAVLSHPNIVKIYDVGFSDEIQFIVMEYIDGITLKEFIEQQGVLRWKDALHFVTQILRAQSRQQFFQSCISFHKTISRSFQAQYSITNSAERYLTDLTANSRLHSPWTIRADLL